MRIFRVRGYDFVFCGDLFILYYFNNFKYAAIYDNTTTTN